jgi:hypothetical protein
MRYTGHHGATPKLYTKSTTSIKQQISPLPGAGDKVKEKDKDNSQEVVSVTPEKSRTASAATAPTVSAQKQGKNLFADSTVPCFFR